MFGFIALGSFIGVSGRFNYLSQKQEGESMKFRVMGEEVRRILEDQRNKAIQEAAVKDYVEKVNHCRGRGTHSKKNIFNFQNGKVIKEGLLLVNNSFLVSA